MHKGLGESLIDTVVTAFVGIGKGALGILLYT
jgi:hypothetical protein